MQTTQNSGGPLEDRLRSLILSNAENTAPDTENKDTDGPADVKPSSGQQPPPGNKHPKRRPNQAQRRQMNAQLSIPIDPRPVVAQNSNSAGFNFPAGSSRFHQKSGHTHPTGVQGGFALSGPPMHGHPFPPQQLQGSYGHGPPASPDWRRHNEPPFRGVNVISADAFTSRPPRSAHASLYNPGGHRQYVVRPEELIAQNGLLETLANVVIRNAEIEHDEIAVKEAFRGHVEEICRAVISHQEININGLSWFPPHSVQLKCFGSLASGFATKAADMDLGLLSPSSLVLPDAPDSPIPRMIEKALLDAGFGARLLTKTRVPIIKLCEQPNEKLRRDLLEERAKWEKGLSDDDDDEHDVIDDPVADANVDRNAGAKIATTGTSQVVNQQHSPGPKGEKTQTEQLSMLRQSENQSLLSYYGLAKKILRRMNGRDITHSNAGDFKEADFNLLNDVCVAFINGLYDDELKRRVKSFPSFSPNYKLLNRRSLHGVFTLAEGERLVMLWDNRVMSEGDERLEETCSKVVSSWRDLQGKRLFGVEPLVFNKELHVAVERLRLIPSIQLVLLQQEQYESPGDYHSRAIKIVTGLNGTASAASAPRIPPQIVQYYISGIKDEQIRHDVEEFVRITGTMDLRIIARKHKCLHLAAEYVKAVEKGLYNGKDVLIIQEYVKLLHSQLVPRGLPHSDFFLRIPETHVPIVQIIRQLPDPSQLAPNLPRDKYYDKLEFPKTGVGVQCDINFSAHLALQNTRLLRCYSYTDPRVRPMVLFVKHWAKARGINTPYRGTLSSYGYVLMVLHYLVNIAQPFVCPNLQELAPPDPSLPPEALEGVTTCKGRNVRFWRDEQEIQRLANDGVLNQNKESIGSLLRGFFEYYAQNNMMSTVQKRGFDWGRDILSLRTHGGLLSKQEKGWTGAKTVIQLQTGAPPNPVEVEKSPADLGPGFLLSPGLHPDQPMSPDVATKLGEQSTKPREFKEVRHRYLFAIEDPFELEHNVARTVTHNGIVSIRDEFRRAWRIIKSAGKLAVQEDLLEDVKCHSETLEKKQFADLLSEIHGVDIHP